MPEHLSLTLTSLLKDLSEGLATKDPNDGRAMRGLKSKLGELRNTLERESSPYLAEVCGLAVRLVDELAANGLVGPKETMDVVADVLETLHTALGVPREQEQPRAPHSSGVSLRLIEGQRIGDLLVTLSMLSPDDVERALKLQKMNGMLLGEALVEQGLVTKESIQAALRLQRARRDRDREGGSDSFETWRASRVS
jgi:hypothetical protein